MNKARGDIRSRVVERRTSHELVVMHAIGRGLLTPSQFDELSRICGIEHPGRLKAWAREVFFEPPTDAFSAARSYAAKHGLRFRTETTTNVSYEARPVDGTSTEPDGDTRRDTFTLDPERLGPWLVDQHDLEHAAVDAAGITFAALCSDEVNHTLDRLVAETVDAGILVEPPDWSIGVYALDDLDEWGFLVTVRVSNRAIRPGGAPFFQVADLAEDVRLDDSVQGRLEDVVAAANRLLPLARAASWFSS